MLTMTIKDGKALRIGNDIKIEFKRKREFDTPDKQVSVAVSAPKDVVVMRAELLSRDKPKSEGL